MFFAVSGRKRLKVLVGWFVNCCCCSGGGGGDCGSLVGGGDNVEMVEMVELFVRDKN